MALNGRETDCRDELLECKAVGILPDADHLKADQDLQPVWETEWFKEFTAAA